MLSFVTLVLITHTNVKASDGSTIAFAIFVEDTLYMWQWSVYVVCFSNYILRYYCKIRVCVFMCRWVGIGYQPEAKSELRSGKLVVRLV